MESSTVLAEDIQKAFDDLNNSNVSYSTDAQSVTSGTTHGTHPHSPVRATATPASLSPASRNNNINTGSGHQIPDAKLSTLEAIPQYMPQPPQQQQGEWQILDQQQMLESAYQQNRQRSNPASEDGETEPSSSANTGENNAIIFNNSNHTSNKDCIQPDSSTGATSTFGRLVKSAAKVSWNRFL